MVSFAPFVRRNPGAHAAFFAILLSALTIAELIAQYYRRIPDWYRNEKGLITSDTLVVLDMVQQFSSGQVIASEWIASSVQFWLSDILLAKLAMTLTTGDWLLSSALIAVFLCLLVTGALAFIVRQASGLPWSRSWLASVAAVAAFVALTRFSGSWSGFFGTVHRAFNVAAFFLVCAGLARVVASGRATHPLSWLYLAACLAFGASDALLVVHVAMPVFLATLAWLLMMGNSRQNRGLVVVSALGIALVLTGYTINELLLPFEHNLTDFQRPVVVGAYMISYATNSDPVNATFVFLYHLISEAAKWMTTATTGDNWLNFVFILSLLPLSIWAIATEVKEQAQRNRNDVKSCTQAMLPLMVWSLVLCMLATITLVYAVYRYSWPLFWIPFLSLAVAIACREQGSSMAWKRIERLAVLAIAVVLVIDLSFFRPKEVASVRLECSRNVLDGTGLERGMSHYWHAREVKVTGGYDKLDIVLTSSLLPGKPTRFKKYVHVGNVGHTKGKADYVVVEDDVGDELSVFRVEYGLPSRITTCADEVYLLYESEALSIDDPEVS